MALRYDPDALIDVPQSDRGRLVAKIEWVWKNRLLVRHVQLRHALNVFFYRRVGDYRVVYTYDAEDEEMVIRLVGRRNDVYDVAASLPLPHPEEEVANPSEDRAAE